MPDVLKFKIISSGSRGNSSIIWDSSDIIMIDCGITLKRYLGAVPGEIPSDASRSLLVSHEHWDHASGVKLFTGRGKFDLYARNKTLSAMGVAGYNIGDEIAIGNFRILAMPVPHDAADPVGFIIKWKNRKITVVSDLGRVPDDLVENAMGSDLLAFEANHDVEMLKLGSYPENLKRRILSDMGHLSNEQSAEAVGRIVAPHTRVILTHISQQNNTPETAIEAITSHLKNRGIRYRSISYASQDSGSEVYEMY
ncbi:MAG: MBL fold metallo-hydrolase [Thermoplasmataceae archaeon]